MNANAPISETTVRRAQAGDALAWRTLVVANHEPLRRYLHWRLPRQAELADDFAQQTWLVAVRRLAEYDPARANLSTWLRAIAQNLLRNHFRQRPAPAAPLNGTEPAPDRPESDLPEQVAWALAQLPEPYEAILRMKYLEGLSVAQILAAEGAGATEKSIESRLSRARAAFRQLYWQLEQPDFCEVHP
ncbi:MAG: RNA polymerase sigma factor [Gemmataceae bacterium]